MSTARRRRLLRYVVRVADGLNVNVQLVRVGAAAPYFYEGRRVIVRRHRRRRIRYRPVREGWNPQLIFKCSSVNLNNVASNTAKAALFDALASVAQALGSGRRAEIVDVLAQGERSVDEIAVEIAQSVANTSQHLQVLAKAGLVRTRRDGTRVFYRLASERVGELWAAVRDVAARHVAEVAVLADEYLGERDGVEQITAPELEQRIARGDVVVLDVRPEPEYWAGHIASARSVPLPQLGSLVSDLPRRKEIVAYCRGPYCVYADDAVRLLRERGLKARRLDVGYPEWRRAGLPVEIAS
jgi:rhodanese-related sulfurtransferase